MGVTEDILRELDEPSTLLPDTIDTPSSILPTSVPVAKSNILSNTVLDFDTRLLKKRAEVQEAKKAAIRDSINIGKIRAQAAEQRRAASPNQAVVEAVRAFGNKLAGMGSTSPVVEEHKGGRLTKHKDNTWTATSEDGRTLSGLTEYDARTFSDYTDADVKGRKEDAPLDFIGRKIHGIGQSTVDLGVQGTAMVIGGTTLGERVEDFNTNLAERSIRLNRQLARTDLISPEEIAQYQAGKLPKDNPKFKILSELAGEAQEAKKQYDSVKEFGEKLKSNIPVNRRDQALARTAYQVIAESEGNIAAAWHVAWNHLDILASAGIDSVPWMIAFTAGGPIAQTAILASLAKGKGREAIEEFRTKYKREPTIEEVNRIKMWSAIGTVAEKFGDMAVVKALPGKLAWVKSVQETVKKSTPLSITNLVALKMPLSLGGEAISGAATAASEQMAEHGKITDTIAIGYDALAEAAGTPGGVSAMVAGSAAYKATKSISKAAINKLPSQQIKNNKIKAEEQIANLESKLNSTEPLTFKDLQDESAETKEVLADLNNRIADTEKGHDSEIFKDLYNQLAKIEVPENELTKATEEEFEKIKAELLQDKENLTKELNAPLSEAQNKDVRIRYQKAVDTLKADIEKGDLSDKKFKDLHEETKATVSGELSPIDADVFDSALAEIDVSKTADTEKSVKQIARLGNRQLTDKQNEALTKVAEALAAVKDTGEVTEEPNSFSSVEKLGDVDYNIIEDELNDPELPQENKEILEAEKRRRDLKAEAQETKDKDIKQVGKEVLQGKSDQWMGFDTFRSKIEEVFKDPKLTDLLKRVQIRKLEGSMKDHLKNLEDKLTAFENTDNLRTKSTTGEDAQGNKKVWVVYGHQDPGTGRVMSYTEPKIAVAKSTLLKEKEEGRIAFYIDDTSSSLIETIKTEIKYGKDTIKVVEGHKNTSYFKTAEEQKSKRKKDSEAVSYLKDYKNKKLDRGTLLTDADIEQAELNKQAPPPTVTKTPYSDKTAWSIDALNVELKENKQISANLRNEVESNFADTGYSEDQQEQALQQFEESEKAIEDITAELKLREEAPTTYTLPKVNLDKFTTQQEFTDHVARLKEEKTEESKEIIDEEIKRVRDAQKAFVIKGKNKVPNKSPKVPSKSRGKTRKNKIPTRNEKDRKNQILTTEIIANFRDTADAIKWIIDNTADTSFKSIAQAIQGKIKAGIPIEYVDVFPDKQTGDFSTKGKDIAGQSSPDGVKISKKGLTENTLLHELIHQAVGFEYKNPKTAHQHAAITQLKNIAKTVNEIADDKDTIDKLVEVFKKEFPNEKNLETRIPRYLKTIGNVKGEELITHGLTSPFAQILLKNIAGIKDPSIKSTDSLWANFTQAIRALLNIPDSVSDTLLSQVLDASAVFIFSKPEKESGNFIERFSELFPAAITADELNKNILQRAAVTDKSLSDKARRLKEAELLARNRENILNILGKKFSDLVGMKKSEGIHTIPDEAFLLGNEKVLKQALIDLMSKLLTKEYQSSFGFSLEKSGKDEIEKSADVLVKQYTEYKKRYDKIVIDLDSHTNPEVSGNWASEEALVLLYRNGQLPPQVIFTMMLGMTTWRQQHQDNVAFPDKQSKQAFLYDSYGELSRDENRELNSIKFNYKEAAKYIGGDIIKTLKMYAIDTKNDVNSDAYFTNLTTALGLAALQVEHGIFDNKTIDGQNLDKADYQTAESDANAKIQIETRKWNFDEQYKEDRTYNNPITKDDAKKLTNEKIEGTAKNKFKDTVESNTGKYRHIRVNTDQKVSEEESVALKSILNAVDSGVDTEGNFPLQTAPEIDNSIDNSITGIPTRVKNVVRKLQKNIWSAGETMSFVGLLANSKYRSLLDEIAGIEELTEDKEKRTHEVLRQSIKSANDNKKTGLDRLLESFSLGKLKQFYFKYKFQNQLRLLMEGGVNPQQNKNTRVLVKSYKPVAYKKSNFGLFKLAVAFNFGIKVDKQSFSESIQEFNTLVNDKNIQDAVVAIKEENVDKFAELWPLIQDTYNGNMSALHGLVALSKYMPTGDPAAAEFDVLTQEKEFISDVIFEVDATSSGFAINALQFPQFQSEDGLNNLEDILSKVGIQFGDTEYDPAKPDIYNSVADKVKQYEGIEFAEEYADKNKNYAVPDNYENKTTAINFILAQIDKLRDIVKYPFIMFLYGGGDKTIPENVAKTIVKNLYIELDNLQKAYVDSAEEQSRASLFLEKPQKPIVNHYKILGVERDADKNALKDAFRESKKTDKDYNAKKTAYNILFNQKRREEHDKTLDNVETKTETEIVKNVLGKQEFIRENIIPFINRLTAIEAFKKGKGKITNAKELLRSITAINTKDKIGQSQDKYFNDAHLIYDMGRVVRPRFSKALNEMLGGTTAARQAVVSSGEILHAIFTVAYKEAYEEALIVELERTDEKTGEVTPEIKRSSLTQREIKTLLTTTLKDVFPQVKSALASESDSNLDQVLSLLSTSPTGQVNRSETVEFSYSDKNNKKTPAVANTYNNTFLPPGVSTLIRLIINIDASTLTETLNTFPMLLALHDALMGSPGILQSASARYGNVFKEINEGNNVLANILEQVENVTKANPDLMKEANAWILKNGYDNKQRRRSGEKLLSINEIRKNNDEAHKNNTAALKTLHDKANKEGIDLTSHMGIPRETKEDKERTEDPNLYEVLKEKLTQLPFDFKDTSAEQELEKKVDIDVRKYYSIEWSKRKNSEPVKDLTGDIDINTITTMFNKLKGYSGNYYKSSKDMDNHTSVLKEVFDLLGKGMDETTRIKLNTEEIDGITQGKFTEQVNKIRISLNRRPPLATHAQSPQEVYVHELVHAMTSIALEDNPLIGNRIERLYKQIKSELNTSFNGKGFRVFLVGIENPTLEDIRTAQTQYDYIFNNPENEANKLHEFLAYSVTNKQMIDYLTGRTFKKPTRKGIFRHLISALDTLVDTFIKLFNKRFYAKHGSEVFLQDVDAYHEMLAITERLVSIQSKHQSILEKFESYQYSKLSKADENFKEFLDDTYYKVTPDPDDPNDPKIKQVTGAIAQIPRLIFSDNTQAFKQRQTYYRMLSKSLRGIAAEIGGGELTEALIEQLLHAKVRISKARQETERFTTNWFNGMWKSVDATKDGEMSVYLREALTDVVLRTDLASLLAIDMSHKRIIDMLDQKSVREREKRNIEQALKNKMKGNVPKAIQYAKELGFHIATGDRALPIPHMNAHTIADRYLINSSKKEVDQLEAYATLEALEHTNREQIKSVSGLAKREFKTDVKENGFIDLLDGHTVYKEQSYRGLFKENATQMVKGYIIERVDDLTHTKTGTLADRKKMRADGYYEEYPLGDIPGIPASHTILYATRTVPEVTDASGIMSTTNQRAMGTTLTEIYSKDSTFHHTEGSLKGKPDFRKIKATIKTVIASETKKAQVKNLTEDTDLKLTPLKDENGKITDFRVMMNHYSTKKILRPDLEIQNVFAHMNSALIDRQATLESNIETVNILVEEQEQHYENNKKLFKNILDPTSPYIERYRKLPRAVREYIKKYAVDGKFMVREDIIDKTFGYKVNDITQLQILQNPNMAHVKRFAGIAHSIVKTVVSYGKDRIVIAMPQVILNNLMSNIYQLSMRKIPLSYTISKIIEGRNEYEKYRKDNEELMKLDQRIALKNLDKRTSPEGKEAIALRIRLKKNKIHRMSEAGLNSLIVEDVNDARIDGFFNQARRRLKTNKISSKYIDKIPKQVNDVAATLFVTKTSLPYQKLRKTVQLTDFLGRYVMMEHAVNVEGVDFKTAMHRALNAFVLFDEVLLPVLEMFDAIGATSFLSYYLRNNRASRELIQNNPTSVGLSAAFQYTTGVATLGNVNSSWLGGDFSPNLMQFDELFDEANNATGVEIVTWVKGLFT